MAILKHIASKNADYGAALRYLIFQYDGPAKKTVLDGSGGPVLREAYFLDGINCDPFTFDEECMDLNALYHKNQGRREIRSHHYIISFDPKDKTENGLTGEQAQKLGMEFAQKNLPGHQALVCTHMDGSKESGNIHVHIVMNSLRKYDVERQGFMERRCDSLAGYKHHLTPAYLRSLKQSLMNLCHREDLCQVDLLSPAAKKVTDKEYRAEQRGQEALEKENQKMAADGIIPRHSRFETRKQFLRDSIEDAVRTARSLKEFQDILSGKYGILLKESRGRFSYLHPDRKKYITGRNLGMHYEKGHLLQLMEENKKTEKTENKKAERTEGQAPEGSRKGPDRTGQALQGSPDISKDGSAVLSIKSGLRLVTDLQACVKAQQNQAYMRKAKLSNLKEMAKTVAYIQEHGYGTRASLEASFAKAKEQTDICREALKSIGAQLQEVNEQIHYTGQYFANKAVYSEFCKSKDKGKFRREHSDGIALYEEARTVLKERSGNGELPSMKILKEKKQKLLEQKQKCQEMYQKCRGHQKELEIVCSNTDRILGSSRPRQTQQEKGQDLL